MSAPAASESGRLHDAAAVRKIANRLKRAQGQLTAVIGAMENGGDCRAVVTQLAAVSSAIDRAGFAIISTALRECITDENSVTDTPTERPDDADGATEAARSGLTIEELEKLFLTLA
ncbi:metal-sensing transcriptional repressor [Herbiconiux sp.]|uniref:metal-sensitive transcriptional regulator n=1 Tax=Herbiconiux sp. TaxID=1871186 RepID=UPI0025BF7B55|nr:metal-sensing transcriptional repressor [Herbiconiux sp.]